MARVALSSQSAINRPSVETLEGFCSRYGVSSPFDMDRIRAGRNNEVWRISNRDGQWILKNYYQHSTDKRDRLGTEFGFLRFLRNSGVCGVSQPLEMDRSSYRALYSFLPGTRPSFITSLHITQAANFISDINRFRESPEAATLPGAADSCLSWKDHLELTETRIGRLMSMKPDSELEIEAHALVKERFLPLWSRLKNKLLEEKGPLQLAEPLPCEDKILSPSDFGFHNTLEDEGSLFFVDFEYAGWDDPAKLICDMICQPELPISESQGWQFTEEILCHLSHPETIKHRVEHLLPMHRLKWCCILLNEFRIEDRKRRFHAGVESAELLANQLSKATQYFNAHLASLN